MSDTRGRLDRDGPYKFRVFEAIEIEPDDLIHWCGERFYVVDVHDGGDDVIIETRDGNVEIPKHEEVSVQE